MSVRKYRRFGHLLAATTASTLVVSGVTVASAQDGNTVSISITNFTDFHGHLLDQGIDNDNPTANTEMGAARLAALMDYVGEDNDHQLRTTSGDNVGGTAAISAVNNDEATLDALNAMEIDVSAVGNHEFDQGQDDLLNRIVPRSDYPILGANVIVDATGETLLAASHIFELDGVGVKVAVIGTGSPQTPAKVAPSAIQGLTFTDPVAAANDEARRLKESGEADIVVVIQHEDIVTYGGFDFDVVDAAFGGDSHQRYDDLGNNRAQAHEYGKALAELEITYDLTAGQITGQEITFYDYSLPAVQALTPHAATQAIVAQAEETFEEIGSQEIATLETPYLRGSNPGAGPGSNRGTESTANNMIAEASRWAMDDFLGGGQIDFGVMNAGGVREDLEEGVVTYADALTVQPFGNELAYATISGQAFIDALENQWQPGQSRPRLSLGVSNNVSYSYDPTAPQGERIINVTINGEDIDPARDYTVAASTFLFEGGDSFFNPDAVRNQSNVGYLDITAFTDYLGSEGNPTLRTGQGEIGITGHQNLVAGGSTEIELSSLNYSTEGEPMANNVTVEFAGTSQTVAIDNAVTEADAGFGEQGRATVTLDVPVHAEGAQEIRVTTDAGTDISVPVTVTPAPQQPDAPAPQEPEAPAPQQPDTPAPTDSSSVAPLPLLTIITAIIGVLGGIIALMFPTQIDALLPW